VSTELKAQILTAVEATHLCELEDADFGFTDVTPQEMLQHLQTNYAVLTPEALEANHSSLSDPWNPDEPLENLWRKIFEVQRTIATAGGAPIMDVAAITLTLAMFETSGLLSTTTQQWRVCPVVQWTLPTFQSDFTLANTERIQQTTAAGAGFHGANAAAAATPGQHPVLPTQMMMLPPMLSTLPPMLPTPHHLSTSKVDVSIIAGPTV
jgi:hypothetical protein